MSERPTRMILIMRSGLSWLDAAESQYAARFAYQADRQAYTLAHALRRLAVSKVLAVLLAKLYFSSEASGKPVLVNAPSKPKIYFSHSRSRNLVACAVTCVGPVGIDVEAVNASIADMRLLDRFVALPDQRMCQVIKLACRVIRQPRSFFTGLCWRRTGNPGAVGCHLPIPALASNQAAADGLR